MTAISTPVIVTPPAPPAAPAAAVIRAQPGPQEAALASPADMIFMGGQAGGSKALALTTPIPTPSGWTTMGEIKVGDVLFDEAGWPCTVIAAHAINESPASYRITFDDGVEIEASADHLWFTYTARDFDGILRRNETWRGRRRATRPSRATWRTPAKTLVLLARNRPGWPAPKAVPTGSIRTTEEIAATLTVRGGRRRNHAVPVTAALQLPRRELPIDPYVLGVWLGDGTRTNGSITMPDAEIRGHVRGAGYDLKSWGGLTWNVIGLSQQLAALGIRDEKRVPSDYLRASAEQRLALLQGLMDTDGTCGTDGGASFTNTNQALADAVYELAASLGIKPHRCERRARLYGRDCGPAWHINWTSPVQVFRLMRKARRLRQVARPTGRYRYVVACEKIEAIPMRCIEVNSASRLYLAGRAMIPTHNSWTLLLTVVQNAREPTFYAEIFRRTYPELTMTGGLWPESFRIYPHIGGAPREGLLGWRFQSGAKVKFSHMQHPQDRFNWKGAQIPMIGFDQVESFSAEQFWYMVSRNRDPSGRVKPWIFGTCNPVPEDDPVGGWLNRLIAWWIDQETGYAIEERSGALRWMVREEDRDEFDWADDPAELRARHPNASPRSVTFIHARLEDNPALLAADPDYRSRLELLPRVERLRLLGGNWKIRATAGTIFSRGWFRIVHAMPADVVRWIRYWDKAGTEGGGKYSAGVLVGRRAGGRYLVADVVRGQWSAGNREAVILQTARADARRGEVETWVEMEPGSGGKESAENTIKNLAGYVVKADRVTGDKVTRASPLAAQAEVGNVDLLEGEWNEPFLVEFQNFDGVHGFADQVDAASGAFNKLALGGGPVEVGVLGAPVAPRRVTLKL